MMIHSDTLGIIAPFNLRQQILAKNHSICEYTNRFELYFIRREMTTKLIYD